MIYEADRIDMMAKRRDGGVDLFIVSSGPIDASAQTQSLLLDKVENYLRYIQSEDFKKDFPDTPRDHTSIIFQLEEKAPDLLMALCEKIVPWAEDNGAKFVVMQGKETNAPA